MIFNLSLHRTGTQAAHDFFRRAGLRSCHWPATIDGIDYQALVVGREDDEAHVARVLKPIFEQFAVVHDAPLAAIATPLLADYPDARFFAFLRPANEWIKSIRTHIGSRPFVPYEKVVYWHFLGNRPSGLDEVSDNELKIMCERHTDELTMIFDRRTNFLMRSLSEPDPGKHLSHFCGITPPIPLRKIDYRLGHDINADPDSVDAESVG